MSEVTQAPTPELEGLPPRPPSKPSRVPLFIWAGIAVFCLLAMGAALGIYLWSHEAFSSKDLKQATSVKISYMQGKQTNSVVLDGAELRELLDSLTITDTQPGGARWAVSTAGSVEFTLPDGNVARTAFVTPTQLDRANWGEVMVEQDFYRKVNEIATRHAKGGKRIDVMRVDN